jgi:hypothetical protein
MKKSEEQPSQFAILTLNPAFLQDNRRRSTVLSLWLTPPEVIARSLREQNQTGGKITFCWPKIYGHNKNSGVKNEIFNNLQDAQQRFIAMENIYNNNIQQEIGLPMLVEFKQNFNKIIIVAYTLVFSSKELTPFEQPVEIAYSNLKDIRSGTDRQIKKGFFQQSASPNGVTTYRAAATPTDRPPVPIKSGSCGIA